MNLNQALESLLADTDLAADDMAGVMRLIMTGEATSAQIAGILIALRCKGETADEISGAARVMRELATPVRVDSALQSQLVDTCGTGGDAAGIFNVSTASAFVLAAAGGRVAKHGNRSVSSKSGSADVLEAAGVALNLSPEAVAQCVEQLGVGFMFAPGHHAAMKHAIGPRRELGVRTIFNLLGPLTNPAGAPNQVLGVFDARWCEPLARVLDQLGSKHVLVVASQDGLDEISPAAPTDVVELKDGTLKQYTIEPAEFDVTESDLAAIRVADAEQSLDMIERALTGDRGPAYDIVALNAGAAIYVGGLSSSLFDGVLRARTVMDSGAAMMRLKALADLSRRLAT